jgi:hypothetical protein
MRAPDIEKLDLTQQFPIQSQTSPRDKAFLLGAIEMVRESHTPFSYLEIGSFLGGSLAPFLKSDDCASVLSIDDRERQQPDERGAKFDYAGITTQSMLDNLHKHTLATSKLETHDGSIDSLPPPARKYDLAFIDGEHTDEACFRDFLWTLPLMNGDGIVMFHDSSLVYRALKLIRIYLRNAGREHLFFKRRHSQMSAVLLGNPDASRVESYLGPAEDIGEFFARAESDLLKTQVRRRVRLGFDRKTIIGLKVNPPKVHKAY